MIKILEKKLTKILQLIPTITESSLHNGILSGGPYRHVIHGPSPLNAAHLEFLPRLSAAIQIAEIENSNKSWKSVTRELFFVIDALESARCVLDNHLVHLSNRDKH